MVGEVKVKQTMKGRGSVQCNFSKKGYNVAEILHKKVFKIKLKGGKCSAQKG